MGIKSIWLNCIGFCGFKFIIVFGYINFWDNLFFMVIVNVVYFNICLIMNVNYDSVF